MDVLNRRILVADDEPGFRALFRYMLEPRGYTVSTVDDGEAALHAAQNHDYALIFLDVHMPKMNGPEVLRQLRKTKPNQPVAILSSAHDTVKVSAEANALGATAYFQKPFETGAILRLLERTFRP